MTKNPARLVAVFLCIMLSLSAYASASSTVTISSSQWADINGTSSYNPGIKVTVLNIFNKLKTWETSYFNTWSTYLSKIQSYLQSVSNDTNRIDDYVKGLHSAFVVPFSNVPNHIKWIQEDVRKIAASAGGSGFDYRAVLDSIHGDTIGIKNNTASVRTDTSAIAASVSVIEKALYGPSIVGDDISVGKNLSFIQFDVSNLLDVQFADAIDNGKRTEKSVAELLADLRNAFATKVDQEIRDNVADETNAYKDHFSTKPNKDNIGGLSSISDGASKWFSTDVTIADAGGMFDQFDQNLAGWFSGTTASQISVGGADAASNRDLDPYVAPDTPDLDSWLDEAHRIAGGLSG